MSAKKRYEICYRRRTSLGELRHSGLPSKDSNGKKLESNQFTTNTIKSLPQKGKQKGK